MMIQISIPTSTIAAAAEQTQPAAPPPPVEASESLTPDPESQMALSDDASLIRAV
jgi:hypothetical protein